jgi:glycosyltransferase involved in cell wall biosynthesis
MKVVYCINQLERIGGTERITIAKANALSELQGNDVYIIVSYNRKANDSIAISGNVKVVDLDVHYYDDCGYNRISGLFFYLRKRKEHRKKLELALNTISPDIVISVGGAEKQFLPTLKIISNPVFIREMHFHKNYRRLLATGFYEKTIARVVEFIDYCFNINKYNRIVVLTEGDKNDNWKNNPKVVVIPNPLTSIPLQVSTLENKIVIAAGRLVKEKNFGSLISAWSYVTHNYPDWHLKIFGDGNKRLQLQAQIDSNNLSDYITLCGFTDDILLEMSNASIYVFSSLCEGFGLVIVEAMSCGLPVISYDCPCGPKDIITHGINGYLVHLNDEKDFAERISMLISNESKRKKMGNNALERSRYFSMNRVIEMWMALFCELLNSRQHT